MIIHDCTGLEMGIYIPTKIPDISRRRHALTCLYISNVVRGLTLKAPEARPFLTHVIGRGDSRILEYHTKRSHHNDMLTIMDSKLPGLEQTWEVIRK